MKIVFVSNYHNHHQISLCDSFLKHSDVELVFIATEKVPEERIKYGYKHEFSYLSYYREAISEEEKAEAEKLCMESDVTIIGSAPDYYIKRRLRQNKLTFLYSERMFKNGFFKHPGDVRNAFLKTARYNFKPMYILCAGSAVKSDCRKVGFFGKAFKWGYFPIAIEYDESTIISNKSADTVRLLWVGRMIYWKHPEIFLHICKHFSDCNIPFSADMIGEGNLKEDIADYVYKNNLTDKITMHGGMTPEQVRTFMEKANIFVFSSDREEGWGAVLNEAMNSACAVVANKEAGSTEYLIRHGYSGLIYRNKDEQQAIAYTVALTNHRDECLKIGLNAYRSIRDVWNADVAVERFIEFSRSYLQKSRVPFYENGPFSKA